MELLVFPIIMVVAILMVLAAAWAFGDIPDDKSPPEK